MSKLIAKFSLLA